MKAIVSQELGQPALAALPRLAPQCEGTQHSLGTWGHDSGPARFRKSQHCPSCGHHDVRLLCEGRVRDMLARPFACDECSAVIPVPSEYLRLERLDNSHDAAPVALSIVSEVRDPLDAFTVHQRGQGLAQTTVRNRDSILRTLERHAGIPLLEMEVEHLRGYLGRGRISAGTRRTERGAMVAFFTFAHEEGWCQENPTQRLAPVTAPKGEPRPFTREQVDAMLTSGAYRRTRAMILLGYYQGFRVSQIAAVHSRDLDLDSGTIRTIGKGKKDALLPLHPVVRELAQTMPRDAWWFPARNNSEGHVSGSAVTNLITLAKIRAGITDPKLTPHSLRHAFGTDLVEAGVDIRVIKELMMHADLSTTQIYTGVSAGKKQESILMLESRGVSTRSGRRERGDRD